MIFDFDWANREGPGGPDSPPLATAHERGTAIMLT